MQGRVLGGAEAGVGRSGRQTGGPLGACFSGLPQPQPFHLWGRSPWKEPRPGFSTSGLSGSRNRPLAVNPDLMQGFVWRVRVCISGTKAHSLRSQQGAYSREVRNSCCRPLGADRGGTCQGRPGGLPGPFRDLLSPRAGCFVLAELRLWRCLERTVCVSRTS